MSGPHDFVRKRAMFAATVILSSLWGTVALPAPVPRDVTAEYQIARSGLRLDRRTGELVQQVTLRYVGKGVPTAPDALTLELRGLPAATAVVRDGMPSKRADADGTVKLAI